MPKEEVETTTKELHEVTTGINVQSIEEMDQEQQSTEDLEDNPESAEDLEDGQESNEGLEEQESNEEQESGEDLGELAQESAEGLEGNVDVEEVEVDIEEGDEEGAEDGDHMQEEVEGEDDDGEQIEEDGEDGEQMAYAEEGEQEEDGEYEEQTEDAEESDQMPDDAEEVEQLLEDAEEIGETEGNAEEDEQMQEVVEGEQFEETVGDIEQSQDAEELEQIIQGATEDQIQETTEEQTQEAMGEQTQEAMGEQTQEAMGEQTQEAMGEQTQEAMEEQTQEAPEEGDDVQVPEQSQAIAVEQLQGQDAVEVAKTDIQVAEQSQILPVESQEAPEEVKTDVQDADQSQKVAEEVKPDVQDAGQSQKAVEEVKPDVQGTDQSQNATKVKSDVQGTGPGQSQGTGKEVKSDVQDTVQSQKPTEEVKPDVLGAKQDQKPAAAEGEKSVDLDEVEYNPAAVFSAYGQSVEDPGKAEEEESEPMIAGVSPTQYQDFAKELLELIVHYKQHVHLRPPVPDVEPGFLRKALPGEPPQEPEPFTAVLQDVQDVIMKGIVNHQSPFFHGYYPLFGSGASRLGSMLQEAFGYIAAKWSVGPSVVELEMHVLDWLVKSLALPEFFLYGGNGGGVLVTSTSESTLIAMCAARNKKIKELMAKDKTLTAHEIHGKLVLYSSQEAHFCHEKMSRYAAVKHHQIPVDKADHMSMTGKRLKQQMDDDKKKGLIPFYVVNTLGTTSTCAFDKLAEIGPLCTEYGCWLHVDAAYAGSAFLCPEFRHHLQGAEHAHSMSINFYKWMLVGLHTCGFWVKDSSYITREFGANAKFFQDTRALEMPDYVDWQLHTCKTSRSLQLWFVIRLYGIKGLQQHIRSHVEMAKYTAKLLDEDDKFTVVHPQSMGLVCFKLKDQPDSVNQRYLQMIEQDRRIFLIGSYDSDGFFLRISMNGENVGKQHLDKTIGILDELADKCLKSLELPTHSSKTSMK